MVRKRRGNTKPDPNSHKSYFKNIDFQNPLYYQRVKYDEYFNHYYTWLQQIAYQLFEWEGFVDAVPVNYLEMTLMDKGQIGYHEHPKYGDILVNGTGAMIGNYNVPTRFQSADIYYKDVNFPVYYYGRYRFPDSGFIIKNKMDYNTIQADLSMLEVFRMYATRLAFIKTISDINLNTQKTPYFITYDDDLLLEEIQKVFTNIDGNVPAIVTKAVVNEKGENKLNGQLSDMIKVLDLKSPYLVDKLETQKQKEWDEAMSRFGLMNISQYKKERMTKSESEANVQQVLAMQNALLKPRKEFCHLYNTFYEEEIAYNMRKEISVKPFTDTIETETGSYQMVTEETGGETIEST